MRRSEDCWLRRLRIRYPPHAQICDQLVHCARRRRIARVQNFPQKFAELIQGRNIRHRRKIIQRVNARSLQEPIGLVIRESSWKPRNREKVAKEHRAKQTRPHISSKKSESSGKNENKT